MALGKALLAGVVAFVVAAGVARAVGGKRLGTRIGLLAGGAVAASTWLAARRAESGVERADAARVAE